MLTRLFLLPGVLVSPTWNTRTKTINKQQNISIGSNLHLGPWQIQAPFPRLWYDTTTETTTTASYANPVEENSVSESGPCSTYFSLYVELCYDDRARVTPEKLVTKKNPQSISITLATVDKLKSEAWKMEMASCSTLNRPISFSSTVRTIMFSTVVVVVVVVVWWRPVFLVLHGYKAVSCIVHTETQEHPFSNFSAPKLSYRHVNTTVTCSC